MNLLVVYLCVLVGLTLVTGEQPFVVKGKVDGDEVEDVEPDVAKFLAAGYSVELLPSSAQEDFIVDSDKSLIKIKVASVSKKEKERGYDYLHDRYYNFIPRWLGTVYDNGDSVEFNTSCFQQYVTTVKEFTNVSATIEIKASNGKLLCSDLLLVASLDHFIFHEFHFLDEHHSITMTWNNETEYLNAKNDGIVIFLLPNGVFGSVLDLWETYHLFKGAHSFDDGLQLMKDHMNITFTPRNTPNFIPDESEIRDGDYLAIFGFSAGFNGVGLASLIALGTGGHTSHTALFLRFDGVLNVVESNNKGIIRTEYRKWMNTTGQNLVSIIRLRDDLSSLFNSTAAIAFFESVAGLPYGTETFVYGWIDTINGNFPPPLSGADLPVALALGSRLIPNGISVAFGQGLNIRLNSSNLSIDEIFQLCDEMNITVNEVVTYPELESFVYQNPKGPRMVCDVFAMRTYKAAGIFADSHVDFQASEFTPKDSYQIQIYADEWERPKQCSGDYQSGVCQINGAYWLDLKGFNTIEPYNNMNEECTAVPVEYIRTPPFC